MQRRQLEVALERQAQPTSTPGLYRVDELLYSLSKHRSEARDKKASTASRADEYMAYESKKPATIALPEPSGYWNE